MRQTQVDATDYHDIASIFNNFAGMFPALEQYRTSALFALNSDFARPDTQVVDGDEVAFFPPVSGG